MSQLRLLVDENIPFAEEAFGSLGRVETAPGRAIGPDQASDIDALLVRSVTAVGPELLEGSPVQFVGSATIGTDHIDRDYLQRRGIAFAHAPGSNADSVADYVVAALVQCAVRRRAPLQGRTVGIIGCGNIGGRLARRLPALGLRVLKNDPPRAAQAEQEGRTHDFVSLDRVTDEADIITLHVPMETRGPHPTYHLFDDERLRAMRPGAWLVNTSRGAVVDNGALRDGRQRLGAVVLDVWENEPTPDADLMRQVDLATPHIAGYAFDGKVRGTAMLYDALTQHVGLPATWDPEAAVARVTSGSLRCAPPDPALPQLDAVYHVSRQIYDIASDDARLRPFTEQSADERGAFFSQLRKTYPVRREMQQHTLRQRMLNASLAPVVAQGLSVRLV